MRFGGAVQVALSLIHECRVHHQHEYHVVLGPGVGAVIDLAQFPENFFFHKKSFGTIGLHKVQRVQREMSTLESQINPDCVVTTSGPSYWRSRAPHLLGYNLPLYIYPESPYLKKLPMPKKAKLAVRRRLHCYYFKRDSEAIIVQTDDVNQRVRDLLGTDNVYTVTNTHNAWFDDPACFPKKLPEPKPGLFRFLTVSSYYPHKDLELIPEILESLKAGFRDRVEFVLTLTSEEYQRHISSDVPPQIRLVGPVPPPECPALYRECNAIFMPTLAECFSATYPEAMKMRKPIITTDLGFSRGICGKAALYFRPRSAQNAAKQIEQLLANNSLSQRLVSEGTRRLSQFDNAETRAKKILSHCESLTKK